MPARASPFDFAFSYNFPISLKCGEMGGGVLNILKVLKKLYFKRKCL